MNEFERQLRHLPWAEPSARLRRKIFADSAPGSSSRFLRISRRAVGWAAVWMLTGSILGYGLGRNQSEAAPLAYPPSDVIVVETGMDTQFFDQTEGAHEVIRGKWVLHVEPEGGIQG